MPRSALLLLTLLAACGPSSGKPPTVSDLADTLAATVRREGQFLVVEDRLIRTVHLVPVDRRWTIKCGLDGTKVTFGPDIDAVLSYVEVADCDAAIRAIAAAMTALTR